MSNTNETMEMHDLKAQLALQRRSAWNTEFLLANGESFAGLYIAPNNDYRSTAPELTFQYVLDYLLGAFDFELAREIPNGKYASKWLWGFMPAEETMGQPDKRQEVSFPGVYYGVTEDWSMDVHLKTGKYYLIRHEKACQDDMDCYGTFEEPKKHLGPLAKCSIHVTQAVPKLPRDFRPFEPLTPIRSTIAENQGTWGDYVQEFKGPLAVGVTDADAQVSMKKFHDDATRGPQHQVCAISGLVPEEGNRLHIAHIIPTEHYQVYPISGMQDSEVPAADLDDYTPGDKWDMTWDREFNGIALLDHFRSLWVSRFWAIEPETMTIAVLAPYDILIPYHGRKAHFPDNKTPDKEALLWHYRMCIIESLNARSPTLKFQRDLKAASILAVRDIGEGRIPTSPTTHVSPAPTTNTSPPRRRSSRTSMRSVASEPRSIHNHTGAASPNNSQGASSPKRKHAMLTQSLRDPSPHGDRDHPDKLQRVGDIDDVCLEKFSRSLAVMGEFKKRLRSPGSSSRGSCSPTGNVSRPGSSLGRASP